MVNLKIKITKYKIIVYKFDLLEIVCKEICWIRMERVFDKSRYWHFVELSAATLSIYSFPYRVVLRAARGSPGGIHVGI